MRFNSIVLVFSLICFASAAHAQLFSFPPTILGAQTYTTNENVPVTVDLNDLTVIDLDNLFYPAGFTLTLYAGANYTIDGPQIIPDKDFVGNLKVPVTVNDGENESAPYDLTVRVLEVPNVVPQITGQRELTTTEGVAITILLTDLTVTDPDNTFPDDFELKVSNGPNYKRNGFRVTPDDGFIGTLLVPVTVNDGEDESDEFELKITVGETPNTAPIIVGQKALSTRQTVPITIALGDLSVTDPDDTYPADFTLTVYEGSNYTFMGTIVTPAASFSGALKVTVSVNDGAAESDKYELTIDVVPNVVPQITAQKTLSSLQNTAITIKPGDITVVDGDNNYPSGFTVTIAGGEHYTFTGLTVTPEASYIGDLIVPITVNDGISSSAPFNLTISIVEPANTAPVISGQDVLSVPEDNSIALVLGNLKVIDPDDVYPTGFTLTIRPPASNAKYTVNANRIIPAENFSGELSVPVTVNDGRDESAVFNVIINVTAVNDAPVITAQKTLSTYINTPITLEVSDFTISDPDDTQFTLKVNQGVLYTVSGNTVTPSLTIPGEINVGIQVSDGEANSAVRNIVIKVINAPNVAPTITAQKPDPLITVQNVAIEIKLDNLLITDPDDKDQTGFKIKIANGANYTVTGRSVKPANNFIGTLQVPVRVNDGTDDSSPFSVEINVIAPSAKPQIIGQSPLTMVEDGSLPIKLEDLIVTDNDDTYPNGFTMQIFNGAGYTIQGSTIVPTKDLNGFLSVNVTVTDDDNKVSDVYGLTILISAVNDAPVISQIETDDISYEPGTEPISLTATFTIEDVDNENLSFAEVGIKPSTYAKGYDHLIFTNTANIRGFFDQDNGKLSLIGYAPLQEYQDAIRSIQYEYDLNLDETGIPVILPRDKQVFFSVNDGQLASETKNRNILMETDVSVEIPNAFTPNGDPDNDTWQVIAKSNPQQCENAEVRVYNRHGQLLFHSIGIEKQWDGSYNGHPLPTDTYFYTVDLNLTYAKKTYTGVVTLIR